jgi:CheY-like chemotaxis protein
MDDNKASTQPLRILVIDDAADIREYLELVLSRAGFVVTSAGDGDEALALLATSPPPNVILLDIMMPRMDGRTCLDLLSADPVLSTIPVIVVSASPYPIPSGARAALVKPFRAEDLLATIARLAAGERRAAPRYAARFDVITHDGRHESLARAVNFSRGGILLRSPMSASAGHSLLLTLALEDGHKVSIESEVRHANLELGGWTIGARVVTVRAGGDILDQTLRQREVEPSR